MRPDDIVSLIDDISKESEIYKDVANNLVKIAKTFGPEVYQLAESLILGVASIKIATFKKYIDAGMTREEALALTMQTFDFKKINLRK